MRSHCQHLLEKIIDQEEDLASTELEIERLETKLLVLNAAKGTLDQHIRAIKEEQAVLEAAEPAYPKWNLKHCDHKSARIATQERLYSLSSTSSAVYHRVLRHRDPQLEPYETITAQETELPRVNHHQLRPRKRMLRRISNYKLWTKGQKRRPRKYKLRRDIAR